MWASSPTRAVGWVGFTGPEEYRDCGTMWASSPTRDMDIDPCAKKAKTRLALLGVSRVKNTCYTARKNFTRNRAEMA